MVWVAAPVHDGVSLMLAVAKLRAFELHDLQLTGASSMPVDPLPITYTEEEEPTVFNLYALIVDDGAHMLAGITSDWFGATDVAVAKGSVGEFAKELRVPPPTFETLMDLEVLDGKHIVELADQLEYVLPVAWDTRLFALVDKHRAVPLADRSTQSVRRRYRRSVLSRAVELLASAEARRLCTCGNFAGADGLCNSCRLGARSRPAPPAEDSPSKRTKSESDEGDGQDGTGAYSV